MFETLRNFRRRLTTALLSLLVVFAAEEKACPLLPERPADTGSPTPQAPPLAQGDQPAEAPTPQPAPPLQLRATLPDGLAARSSPSCELGAHRVAVDYERQAASGSFGPPRAPFATVADALPWRRSDIESLLPELPAPPLFVTQNLPLRPCRRLPIVRTGPPPCYS